VPANDILIGIGSSSHLPHHVKCKAWQVFSLTVQNNTLIHYTAICCVNRFRKLWKCLF